MPIDPQRPPETEHFRLIQRATFADLPVPNTGTSPPVAGMFAWVEQTVGPNPYGLYVLRWITQFTHVWSWVGPGGGGPQAILPDVKFVVARTGYGGAPVPGTLGDIIPTTTYTDPNPAVAFNQALAAASAYRAILQALPEFVGLEAKCVVMLHPDHYVGTFAVPDGVTIVGLGANPSDVLVDRLDFSLATAGMSSGARNLKVLGAGAPSYGLFSAPGGVGSGRLDLERIECDPTNGDALLQNRGGIVVRESSLARVTVQNAQTISFESLRTSYLRLTTSNVLVASREDFIAGLDDGADDLSVTGPSAGQISVFRDLTLGRSSAPAKPSFVVLGGQAQVELFGCSLDQALSPAGSLVRGVGLPAPTLYYRGVESKSGQQLLLAPPTDLTVVPLGLHETFTSHAQTVAVNAPGFVVMTPTLQNQDILEVTANYTVPRSSTTYALVLLPDARRLAPNRKLTIKNTGDLNLDGPIALATPVPGQFIDDLSSSSAPASVTSATHIILPPKASITLYVASTRDQYRVET